MPRSAGPKGRRVPRTAVPFVVLGVALGLTAVGAVYVSMSVAARDRLRFLATVHRVEGRIDARMETYTAMMRATDGLFAARFPVTPAEFKMYAGRLDLRRNYPGVFGIGFAVRVPAEQKQYFVPFMRQVMGVPDFRIWPESSEDERTSIVYLEPLDERNAKAVGYDMYTNPIRREAMRRARDGGTAAASGRVLLVQDMGDKDPTTGFLIYLPVYEGGAVPPTVEERRAKLKGYVYSPFRSKDLFGDVFAEEVGGGLEVRIYDGARQEAGDLLYRTSESEAAVEAAGLQSVQELEVAGRPWTVVMATGPGFYRWPSRYLPLGTALGGLGLSLGLFGLVRGQVRARLRAERVSADLRASRAALRRSEGKFRRLTDSNLIGVVFSRLSGEAVDGNDEFLRMIGATREQMVRGEVRWDRMTPPEYAGADERAMGQLRERGVCEPYEKEFVRADGTRVPVMVGVAVLEGTAEETVGFAMDLTEVKRAQQALREAKESAEAANRLKDEFLATVSHELRTPLNAILGWAQLLAVEGPGAEDAGQGIDTILRNARAQAQLIEDLLDISRIVSGKLRLEARAVDLGTVANAAVDSVALAAEAKGVELVRDVAAAEPVEVWGDPDRLQQVAWNLLSNAIKFTGSGGAIRVCVARDGRYARLSVSDSGEGIDPAFLPYAFERFRQADASLTRKHGGLGLGLSIVKSLVEMHGGTVRAESEGAGRGATFAVTLPLRSGAGRASAAAGGSRGGATSASAAAAAGAGGPVSLEGVRVLVVDDDADARELVRHILAGHRAEVVMAATVARALEVMRSQRVDVLVSDLAMPEGDGYDLIRAVRELPTQYGGRVPAVALSALVRPAERERALAAGYNVHLPKPVDAGVLAAVVGKLRADTGIARVTGS